MNSQDPTHTPQTNNGFPPVQNQPQPIYPHLDSQPGTQQPSQITQNDEQKDFVVAFLLSWLLGAVGADRFYLGYTGLGIAKLLTLGGLGIWALIDTVLLAFGKLKDRHGLPLKGYDRNKKWVRILALIHLIILGLIILGIMLSIFATTTKGVRDNAEDLEKKTDIDSIHVSLESHKSKHGYYPTLDQINSKSFREKNMPDLTEDAIKDPRTIYGPELQLLPSSITYSYKVTPEDCNNVGSNSCLGYTLTATLNSGGYYTKGSAN